MNRAVTFLVAGLCLGMSACDRVPGCGANPPKPDVVRSVDFYGRVTADSSGWTIGRNVPEARVVVGGRTVVVDAETERLGYCANAYLSRRCAAYVGLRRPGVAAWMLLAQLANSVSGVNRGRFEVTGVLVWKLRARSMVLSQGVELRFGRTFADVLERTDSQGNTRRDAFKGPQVSPTLYIDPRTGEVLDVFFGGCM